MVIVTSIIGYFISIYWFNKLSDQISRWK